MSVRTQQITTNTSCKLLICFMQQVSVYKKLKTFIFTTKSYIYKCIRYLNNTVHYQYKQLDV